MQYMLGLTAFTGEPLLDPSLFVTIRNRITIEDINALTQELAGKKKDGDDEPDKTRHTDIKADAT